jgi:hypothetical protein
MSSPKMLPIAALAILYYLPLIQAEEPMLQVLVTQSGLNGVGEVGVEYLSQIFPGMSLSSLSGDYDDPILGLLKVGYVHWYIRDVHFFEITLPTTTVASDPDAEHFMWSVSDAGFIARGYLNYTYHTLLGLVTVSNSVPFNMTVSGVDITVNSTITKNALGLPQVNVLGCKCVIGTTTIHFETVLGWVYNLFNDAIANDLKEALEEKVCEGATHTVDKHANAVMNTTSLDMPMNNGINIGCRLRDNPSLLTELVKAAIVCQISLPGFPPITFSPLPMPALIPPNKMMATAISAEIFNLVEALLYAAHKFDNVLDDSNTQGGNIFLKTDCATNETCIGTLFPEMAVNYTGWKIVIDVRLLEARKVLISTTDISITGRFTAEIRAINQTSEEIVSLYNFNCTTIRHNSYIIVGLNIQYKPLNGEYSSIEFVPALDDATSRNILISFVFENLRLNYMKNLAGGLFTLPKVDGISWIDPVITQINGAIVFTTNVAFTPF